MEYINLGAVIEQAIARFGQNRIGERPPVFLVGSSTLPDVPWHDTTRVSSNLSGCFSMNVY